MVNVLFYIQIREMHKTKGYKKRRTNMFVYRIGFNGNDETEVDAESVSEAIEIARVIAMESGYEEFLIEYIDFYGEVKD
jgi:hypothetical protein